MNLKSYRKQKEMRQCDLAVLLGVDQTTISKLEAGVVAPSLELAFAIEKCTGGSVPARIWLKDAGEECAVANSQVCQRAGGGA